MLWDESAKSIFEKSTQCCICEEGFQDQENVIITILLDNFEVQRILNVIPNIKLRKVVISLSLIIYLYSVHYTIRLLIFFHNLRGYDSHLIFQTVTSKHGRINIIANNSEKSI